MVPCPCDCLTDASGTPSVNMILLENMISGLQLFRLGGCPHQSCNFVFLFITTVSIVTIIYLFTTISKKGMTSS